MPQEGQQNVRQGHGAGVISPVIWGYIGAISGLLVIGPMLGVTLAVLWLEPSWYGAITLALSVLLMGIVLKCFLEMMVIGSGTGGAPSRGQ